MNFRIVCLASLSICCVVSSASARGYYTPQNGTRAAGRGGAFTARADDLSAAAYNPAGFARQQPMFQLDNKFSYNTSQYKRTNSYDYGDPAALSGTPPLYTFNNVQNSQKLQYLDPLLGVSSKFGLEDFAFAFVAYAPTGVAAQQFPLDGGQRYMMVKSQGMFLNYTFNAAWKYKDVFGIGAGFDWIVVPKLQYQLVVNADPGPQSVNPQQSPSDMLSTFTGSSMFTPNAMVGAWFRPASSFEVALAGQVLPANVNLDGTLGVRAVGTLANADTVNGGVATLVPTDKVQLTLPLPMSARLGLRYIHNTEGKELFDIELNVAYETWSRVDKFRLNANGINATVLNTSVDIGTIDIQKQWKDSVTFQLGSDVNLTDNFTLRGGAFYETAVADPAYMNVDFVSGAQLGGAVGVSLRLGDLELSLSQVYRTQPGVAVTEAQGRVYQQTPGGGCQAPYTDPGNCNQFLLGQPGPTVNGGYYQASSLVTALGGTYRY